MPPPPPLEVTLAAPAVPKTVSLPTLLRVNRFTVGSPLVPRSSLPPVPLSELPGLHGAAPLDTASYPELILIPPTISAAQQAIPPPPTPKVRRQIETGPFLGGLVAVCAVVAVLIVGRKGMKRGKGKK